MCLIALLITLRSKSIHFDFSTNDMPGELRNLTNTLLGWLVLAILMQSGSLLFLSIALPVIWIFS
jgi:hypothetical protein